MSRLPYGVRRAGAAVVGRIPVPIVSGPNRGRLWSLASAGRGYATGRFEQARMRTMLPLIRKGDIVWDVGAHKGYVALALARAVGSEGRVLAFEPSYRNLEYLTRHVGWNRPSNLEVLPIALSASEGEASFGGSGSSITYRLGQGDERVRVRTMETLIDSDGRPAPRVMKVDVEGSEVDVLRGAGPRLGDVELLFVAIHGRALYGPCRSLLEEAGFEVAAVPALREAAAGAEGDPWPGDPELVAWRPERGLSRGEVEALPAFGPLTRRRDGSP